MIAGIKDGSKFPTNPRYDDEHTAGDIDCDEVVRELTLEHKINRKAAVFS